MAWLQPLEQFLCCFSLGAAVKLLLVLHLWETVITASLGIYGVLDEQSSLKPNSDGTIFSAAWSLLGLPFICLGIYGTYYRIARHVRAYLFYLSITFLLDMEYLISIFLMKDACVHIRPSISASGRAIACAVARGLSGFAVFALAFAFLYMLFVVWSFCEELSDSDSSNAILKLLDRASGETTRAMKIMKEELSEESELMDTLESVESGAAIVYGSLLSGASATMVRAGRAAHTALDALESLAGGRHHHHDRQGL